MILLTTIILLITSVTIGNSQVYTYVVNSTYNRVFHKTHSVCGNYFNHIPNIGKIPDKIINKVHNRFNTAGDYYTIINGTKFGEIWDYWNANLNIYPARIVSGTPMTPYYSRPNTLIVDNIVGLGVPMRNILDAIITHPIPDETGTGWVSGSSLESGCMIEGKPIWFWLCQCKQNLTFYGALTTQNYDWDSVFTSSNVMKYYYTIAHLCVDGYIDTDLDGYPDYLELGLDKKKCDWMPNTPVDRTFGISDPFDMYSVPNFVEDKLKTRTRTRTRRWRKRTKTNSTTPTHSQSQSITRTNMTTLSKRLGLTDTFSISHSISISDRPFKFNLSDALSGKNATKLCITSDSGNTSCHEKVYCQGGAIGDPHILDCSGRLSTCSSASWQILVETPELTVWAEFYQIVMDKELLARVPPMERSVVKSVRVITTSGQFVYFNETIFEQNTISGYLLNTNGIVSESGDVYVEVMRILTQYGFVLNVQVLVANPIGGLLVKGCGNTQKWPTRTECSHILDNFSYYACNGDCHLLGNCSLIELSNAAEQQRNSLGTTSQRTISMPPIASNEVQPVVYVAVGVGTGVGVSIGILVAYKFFTSIKSIIPEPKYVYNNETVVPEIKQNEVVGDDLGSIIEPDGNGSVIEDPVVNFDED